MKKIILLLLLISQTSCFKEVHVDIPEIEHLPVVNCTFRPDSVFKITLGKTRAIFDEGRANYIEDALVQLYKGKDIMDTLIFTNGSFVSDEKPIANEDYSVQIDIHGFERVKANNGIPPPPQLVSASFKDSVYTDSEGYFLSQAKITFSDNPDEENYYELILRHLYDEEKWDELFFEEPYRAIKANYYYETNDLVIENEGQLAFWAFSNPIFSDELFNGETYTMRINFSPLNLFGTTTDPNVIVVLRSVSKDYYTYKKSLTAHIETQFSDVWDGVVEPSAMFTNIEGGYGIFAGYSQVTDTIYKNQQ